MTGNNTQYSTWTRREFAQAVGGVGVLAAATDPTAAASLRDDPPSTTAETPISDPFTPDDWSVVGPFQYQRRGGETEWLFPEAPSASFGTGATESDDSQRFQSAYAGGATVEWEIRSASDGSVSLDFSDRIDPTDGDLTPLTGGSGLADDFQDWYGYGGVLYGVGYAFTTFEMDEPRRAVLETDASTLWLNGHRYETPESGVVLQEGTNVVLAKQIITLGAGSVSVSFRPPRAPIEVNDLAAFRGTSQNVILPDLRAGEQTDRPASVRVTNTTGKEQSGTLTFAPDSDLLVTQEAEIEPPLAPSETRRIETRVKTAGPVGKPAQAMGVQQTKELPEPAMATTAPGKPGRGAPPEKKANGVGTKTVEVEANNASVVARVTAGGGDEDTPGNGPGNGSGNGNGPKNSDSGNETASGSGGANAKSGEAKASEVTDEQTVPLRIRDSDEPKYQTTYVSKHDDSVQAFSIREPTNPDSSGPFDLIVSLHGANVPSINQAGGGYSQKEDTYLVAPGARGPANYDHEDLGRLDDLETIEVMHERFNIDENRTFLTGHSMGGHGTWHIGMTHSDRFAGIAPSAGWTDHETYITTTFSRDKLHAYPGLKAVKETALQKNLALPKTENAADGNLPVFALHGGKDTSVPTLHPRTYMRALANRGLDVGGEVGRNHSTPDPDELDAAFLEVPGMSHWWDDGIGSGTDCVNHPDLMEFLLSTEHDPYPAELRFFTTNLRVEHEKYWVAVHEQQQVHAPTRVDAAVTDDGIELSTENVTTLALDLEVLREHDAPGQLHVAGETLQIPGRGGTAYVSLSGAPSIGRNPPSDDDFQKDADQYGPLKEIHHDPYLLVYGTQGDDQATALARNLANLRSGRLVERARAPARVVPDTAFDSVDGGTGPGNGGPGNGINVDDYNLVLFGRPDTNAVLDQLADDLPVTIGDGYASVGDETYEGDLGVEFIYPNPEAPDNLVQVESGTSLAGLRLTGARDWTPTQTATADYAVFDSTIEYERWNACRAAGFFDTEWQVDESLGHLRATR